MKCEGFQGATFGVMDAIINIVGITIGLSVVGNRFILLIGLLTAGLANSFGNAAGFHVSEETEKVHTKKEVRKSTVYCFMGTFATVLILVFPLLILQLKYAIPLSIAIAAILLVSLGLFVSKVNKKFNPKKLALEYLIVGFAVSFICYLIGNALVQFVNSF